MSNTITTKELNEFIREAVKHQDTTFSEMREFIYFAIGTSEDLEEKREEKRGGIPVKKAIRELKRQREGNYLSITDYLAHTELIELAQENVPLKRLAIEAEVIKHILVCIETRN